MGNCMRVEPGGRLDYVIGVLTLLSSYIAGGVRVWVITEADRGSTYIFLSEEF